MLGYRCAHPLPVGHVALLEILWAGSHLPQATMCLLLIERILSMMHRRMRLIMIKLLLLMVMGNLLPVMLHGWMGLHGVLMEMLGSRWAMHHRSYMSYLHPKRPLRWRENIPLWAELLARAHKTPRLTLLIHAHHGLVRGQVWSWRVPCKHSWYTLALLIKGRTWWPESYVALAREVLLLMDVVAVQGAVVIVRVLAGIKCRIWTLSNKEALSVLGAEMGLVSKGLHVMRRPLGLTKITWHGLMKVSQSREPLRTHSRSGLALSRRHQGHLYRRWSWTSEVGVYVNVLWLWRLLGMMVREIGWRGAHHRRWPFHLRSQRWRAERHTRRNERLRGLRCQQVPMLLERKRSSWPGWMVLLGLELLLMRLMQMSHSGGMLLHNHERVDPVMHSSPISTSIVHSVSMMKTSASSTAPLSITLTPTSRPILSIQMLHLH